MLTRINRRNRQRKGFSLLELLAVVTILGVIAAVVVPRISTSKAAAQAEANKQNIAEINSAVERWYFEKGTWPALTLTDIGGDVAYFPDGLPVNPVTDAAYALDKDSHRVIK